MPFLRSYIPSEDVLNQLHPVCVPALKDRYSVHDVNYVLRICLTDLRASFTMQNIK
jgi:hypothetical protein